MYKPYSFEVQGTFLSTVLLDHSLQREHDNDTSSFSRQSEDPAVRGRPEKGPTEVLLYPEAKGGRKSHIAYCPPSPPPPPPSLQ